MSSRCRFAALPALACCLLLASAAGAAAAPPGNDNYLASTNLANRVTGRVLPKVHLTVDTTQATIQQDLFDPDQDGQPLGGGGPEPTQCNGVSFGKTIWYDVHPQVTGAGEITANGYDTVIAVYRYDASNAKITGLVECRNASAGGEKLLIPAFRKGTDYTIQIGGVGNTGGTLVFDWEFFADRDADGVLDAVPDRCPNIKGPATESGCPPRLTPGVNLSFSNNPIRFSAATVGNLPQGTRVSVRCRRCGVSTRVTIPRTNKRVTLRGLVGRTAPNGAVLDIVATHPKTPTARFRYGAIGARVRYTVRAGKLVGPSRRCMLPGSTKPRRTCE